MLRGRQILGFKFRRRSLVYGYIPDFWCPQAKVAVEIDGTDWVGKGPRDEARNARFLSRGIRTVHLPSALVWDDPTAAIDRIRSVLELQPGR
jgi:very-short-patch-repair endonuclease